MAKLPYMPWYPADLLSSSDYALMSPLERLAYRELLDRCWMSGGTLPADAEMLARLTVGDVSDAVLAKFIEIDGTDTITNVRLWAEYERAEARHDALSQAGRKGGQSKATGQATSQAKATPQARLKRGHKPGSSIQNQNQNHIQISSKEDSTPIVPKGTKAIKITDTRFDEWWKLYPRKIGKAKAQAAYLKAKALIEKADDSEQLLFDGLTRSPRLINDNPQYIPHPSTWLNEGSYRDEEDVAPRKQASPGAGYQEPELNFAEMMAERDAKRFGGAK